MRRTIRIILEYLLGFAMVVLLLLAIASVVVVKFYGDSLKEHVMDQVNDQLEARMDVEQVSVRMFSKFPSTSIELHRVTIWSSENFRVNDFPQGEADRLMTAERVRISFRLLGLIRKKFHVKELEVTEGRFWMLTDKQGESNFRISSRKKGETETRRWIDLNHISMKRSTLRLYNLAKTLKLYGQVDDLQLSARISGDGVRMKGTLQGQLEELSSQGVVYGSDRELGLAVHLDVQDSVYTIRQGHIDVDRVSADVDGRLKLLEGPGSEINLVAAAQDLRVHEVLDLLPVDWRESLSGARGSGTLQLYTRVSGVAGPLRTPGIEADFQTTGAGFSWDKLPFPLENVNLTGRYTNGAGTSPETTELSIESFSALVGSDQVSGNGQIRNFLDPEFDIQVRGGIHPGQWVERYETLPVEEANGILSTDLRLSGSFGPESPGEKRIVALDISGSIEFQAIGVRFVPGEASLEDLNGRLRVENDFWEPNLTGRFGQSDFHIEGSGLNLISYLLGKDEPLVASATLRSRSFRLDEILRQFSPGKEKRASFRFPERLNLQLDYVIDRFAKDRFVAENVRGTAVYDSPSLFIDSLTMQTMEGTLRGSFGLAGNRNGTTSAHVEASLYRVDINQLFLAFNNFGQEQITHEHLKGRLTGTSTFSAEFDSSFSILSPSILSENEVTIQDGELNNFSPIMALSRFIEVEELRNIRFETLENTILIRDNKVVIPDMDIASNALNLSASGTHAFDRTYDYRLRLRLSELLYNEVNTREFQVAEDASDTRTLFLKLYDTGNGAQVEMDRTRTAEKIRQDMKQEKSELKQILNEELGLFRNDPEIRKQPPVDAEREEVFRFEFPDGQDSVKAPSGERKRGIFRRNRTKPDSIKNKPAAEFVIDE